MLYYCCHCCYFFCSVCICRYWWSLHKVDMLWNLCCYIMSRNLSGIIFMVKWRTCCDIWGWIHFRRIYTEIFIFCLYCLQYWNVVSETVNRNEVKGFKMTIIPATSILTEPHHPCLFIVRLTYSNISPKNTLQNIYVFISLGGHNIFLVFLFDVNFNWLINKKILHGSWNW